MVQIPRGTDEVGLCADERRVSLQPDPGALHPLQTRGALHPLQTQALSTLSRPGRSPPSPPNHSAGELSTVLWGGPRGVGRGGWGERLDAKVLIARHGHGVAD
ncbi:hypothetical protein EYF80_002297 [Liparis tanakae]|uniref:Uncharacterized protein n=1 Tax=Liparis tanakae TaxID=230148 RepID=A0A4Z2JBR4_9TELE|nr:hypothetical protein EYF80_002297 [Liparis tanakae]